MGSVLVAVFITENVYPTLICFLLIIIYLSKESMLFKVNLITPDLVENANAFIILFFFLYQ